MTHHPAVFSDTILDRLRTLAPEWDGPILDSDSLETGEALFFELVTVLDQMLASGHQLKILDRVIQFVSVDVVDDVTLGYRTVVAFPDDYCERAPRVWLGDLDPVASSATAGAEVNADRPDSGTLVQVMALLEGPRELAPHLATVRVVAGERAEPPIWLAMGERGLALGADEGMGHRRTVGSGRRRYRDARPDVAELITMEKRA